MIFYDVNSSLFASIPSKIDLFMKIQLFTQQ